ncbi:hypothetical protein KTO58_07905 [Chitinophaga pendula]|uniref:KamA family radical SAM protein n=1 Tax=Chitinophaga TaxID=79328 RepID=UPI0018DF4391|nr:MULTISPECIES: hypothetical protein [Chitinophaga]UCJ09095.1 hypothetical protein KTO58_07905 [Chitinophaga pendula]
MTKFKSFNINNLENIPQLRHIDAQLLDEIKIVSEVYPFKTNNYVLENLINWDDVPHDPIYRLNFPHREMLIEEHYDKIVWGKKNLDDKAFRFLVHDIRMELNPHPAGQTFHNVPFLEGERLEGMQHKYRHTILFFPSHSQTCHAYCTFCFRWPQFINDLDFKIQAKEVNLLVNYLEANPHVSEVLLTGGDPMIMSPRIMDAYIAPLMKVKSLKTIRIGTKALTYWPNKFTSDPEKEELLQVLQRIVQGGKHLAIMAHFNHWVEMMPPVVGDAISNLRKIGVEIRTQAPLLRNINNNPAVWSRMWDYQVQLGCIPYYMFLPRDTGAQHYFAEPLQNALSIYRQAIHNVSGLGRTVRGPVMSMTSGKVELLDIEDDVFHLRFLQHRIPDTAYRLFKAKAVNDNPKWFDDLTSFSERYDGFFNLHTEEQFVHFDQ